MNAQDDSIYVSIQAFAAPFEYVWPRLSDPLNFPEYYPNWVVNMERSGENEFLGKDETGENFQITPCLNESTGVIDFEIADSTGEVELSRSRLLPLKSGGCVLTHVAVRWDGVSDEYWQNHKDITDKDLANAAAIIDSSYRQAA